MTITLEIPKEIEAQLMADAQASGRPLHAYLRDFIVEHYQEDVEDSQIAEARLSDPQTPISSQQLRKTLGLDSWIRPTGWEDLKAIDRAIQQEILDYMKHRVAAAADPRQYGKPLRHSKRGLWRYRVCDYRIVCQIQEAKLVVLVVSIGHRSTIYR
jgi:mRNA interferase RelE/StbE